MRCRAAPGLRREHDANDTRVRAFPCLVHLDVSLLDNRLHLLAVYRDWHLISKAYGNLIGLTPGCNISWHNRPATRSAN